MSYQNNLNPQHTSFSSNAPSAPAPAWSQYSDAPTHCSSTRTELTQYSDAAAAPTVSKTKKNIYRSGAVGGAAAIGTVTGAIVFSGILLPVVCGVGLAAVAVGGTGKIGKTTRGAGKGVAAAGKGAAAFNRKHQVLGRTAKAGRSAAKGVGNLLRLRTKSSAREPHYPH
eukprot:CAMPEP_0194318308 /NCGR_PEP_ID=MMETSP0171-20130528/14926_1 /TAXON_ID=218684 /ORGANISM="Corethron pennatum, Strain L29A3" /LENGTH=168 /DNA_ID=CAMNT_0039075177 /DNA_START=30 /DNA_END=536 /DNA_ORIENTATION=-